MAGAAQFLQNLPSRGCFSQPSSVSGGLKVYVCQHDTAPPEEQLIKTDATNILIRALTLGKKKGKAEQKTPKDNKGKVPAVEEGKGKRPADRLPDEKPPAKRANTGGGSTPGADVGSSRLVEKDLQTLTVPKLRAMLKEKGLPLKGIKEELIARLVSLKR